MRIRPYGGMILVKRLPADAKIAGGLLHVPDLARKKTTRGEVVEVGPGRLDERGVFRPVDGIAAGDVIAWDKDGAHDVPWKEGLVLVSHEYVLAKLEKEGATP